MMVAVIIALALLVSFWLASRYAGRHLRHMQHYEKLSNDYYKYSKPLIENDDTPKALLELMLFINKKMPDPHSGRQFMISLLVRPDTGDADVAAPQKLKDIEAFFKSRPELENAFEQACHAALRAMSYRSLLFGILLRRLVLFDDSKTHDRPMQLVYELKKRASFNSNSGLGGALGC